MRTELAVDQTKNRLYRLVQVYNIGNSFKVINNFEMIPYTL